ncbi:ubiquitin-40S ribosomal protein S27a isoform 1 [Hibiscus syriacus]|uniref:Ubiquitin-40S ribosomal protein S27a isoform 1 n=1 Tax=Hibiscus syriacus TaxID=106335 RepID=A0A6A2Y2U4_HIBSY|nr:ubiquitin-40S ribosomal protein S27a isoform 1 [Hibiscus syriacus]
MSKLRLQGKVAIITGGASGIGEESVRLFVEHGAFVVITDVQDDLGNQVVASVGLDKVSYRFCDARDEKQVEETVSYTAEETRHFFQQCWCHGLDDRNLGIRHRRLRQCHGHESSCVGGLGPVGYTTSKHTIVGLVRGACSELGGYGIRVNCVSPYGVATPLACKAYNLEPSEVEANCCSVSNLKGIVLKAKHIAEAVLFLASDESVYISGQNLAVDGGFTVVNHSVSEFQQ